MKTKILMAGLLAVIFSGCFSAPAYLPDAESIDVNVYGSYISLTFFDEKENINGELIAVDSSKFIVLVSPDGISKTIKIIPVKEVNRYNVQYAVGNDYNAAIPLFTLLSLAHGLYALATVPFNLIYTTVVAGSSNTSFSYSSEEISLDKLRMFARFPQGIPPNVKIRSIK